MNRMRTFTIIFSIISAVILSLASGGYEKPERENDWTLDEMTVVHGALHYVELHGVLKRNRTLTESNSCKIWVRWFSDDYESEVATETKEYGLLLADEESEPFEISSINVYIQPAIGGLDRSCVQVRADNSNVQEWTDVECIDGHE